MEDNSFLFLYEYYKKVPKRQLNWHIDNDNYNLVECQNKNCTNIVNWSAKLKSYVRFCSSKCAHNDPSVKKKTMETCLKKYGTTSNLNSPENMKRRKETCLKKYGVDNYSKTKEFKERYKETCLKKYGVDNTSKLDSIKEKITETHKRRYGRKRHSQMHIDERIISMKDNYDLMYKWHIIDKMTMPEISKKLGGINASQLCVHFRYNLGIIPIRHNVSAFEKNIQDIIKNEYKGEIIYNDRQCIKPFELDIYLPNLKIAFECNGSYWHSYLNNKTASYHKDKTDACANANIQLMHVWEHIFSEYPAIVKDKILKLLGNKNIISAEETIIISQLDSNTVKVFLNQNTCTPVEEYNISYGLLYKNSLVAIMLFSYFDSETTFRMDYITKTGYEIDSGLNKLFEFYLAEYKPEYVVSVVDKGWGFTNNIFKNTSFEYSFASNPVCYYTNDYVTFFKEDVLLEEKYNDCIWDCGNDVWIYYK